MRSFQWIPKSWRRFLKRFALIRYLEKRLYRQIPRERIQLFLEKHQTKELTLDVGAARSRYKSLFPNTIAGDIAFNYVISDDFTVQYSTIDVQYDAHFIPFPDNCFSTILCTEVLEHCVNPQQVLHEFYRVLKPNGKLILTTRFVFPLHEVPHDYFRFTKYGLEKLCDVFSEVSVESEENTMETLQVLLERLTRQSRWRIPFMKQFLQIIGRILAISHIFLKHEYGDAAKIRPENGIMAAGYLLIAIK